MSGCRGEFLLSLDTQQPLVGLSFPLVLNDLRLGLFFVVIYFLFDGNDGGAVVESRVLLSMDPFLWSQPSRHPSLTLPPPHLRLLKDEARAG